MLNKLLSNFYKKILFFALSGSIGFIVDFTLLFTLRYFFPLESLRLFTMLASIITTWLLNRSYTFKFYNKKSFIEFILYLSSISIGALMNYLSFMYIFYETKFILLSFVIGSFSGFFVNFLLANKIYTYLKKNSQKL